MYLGYFLCGPYYFLYVRILLPVSTQFIPCASFIDSVLNKVDTQYLPPVHRYPSLPPSLLQVYAGNSAMVFTLCAANGVVSHFIKDLHAVIVVLCILW